MPNFGPTAAATLLLLLVLFFLVCALCWAIQTLDMVRARRKEEDDYFGRLLKEHQGSAAAATRHVPPSWITPTPATTPRDAESLAEYWMTKEDAAQEPQTLPFDGSQVEALTKAGAPNVANLRRGPEEQAILDKASKAQWVAAVTRKQMDQQMTAPMRRLQGVGSSSQDAALLRA